MCSFLICKIAISRRHRLYHQRRTSLRPSWSPVGKTAFWPFETILCHQMCRWMIITTISRPFSTWCYPLANGITVRWFFSILCIYRSFWSIFWFNLFYCIYFFLQATKLLGLNRKTCAEVYWYDQLKGAPQVQIRPPSTRKSKKWNISAYQRFMVDLQNKRIEENNGVDDGMDKARQPCWHPGKRCDKVEYCYCFRKGELISEIVSRLNFYQN